MSPNRIATRIITTTILVAAAVSLAACTGDDSPGPTTATTAATIVATPTPTPTVDAATAAATAAVLAAYRGYWDAKVDAFHHPSESPGPKLQQFATDKAFGDVGTGLLTFRRNGIEVVGEPELDPKVTAIDVKAGDATVVDCVDGTNWQPVYTKTGKSAAQPGQAERLVTTSTAIYLIDHWAIRTSVVDHGSSC